MYQRVIRSLPALLFVGSVPAFGSPDIPETVSSAPFVSGQLAHLQFASDTSSTPVTLRAASAQLRGDGRTDILQIVEMESQLRLKVLFSVGTYTAEMWAIDDPLATQHDVAVLTGQGANGVDVAVSVGSLGLMKHSYSFDQESAIEGDAIDTAWSDVTRVEVSDLNGDGLLDVAGLGPSGQVRIKLQTQINGVEGWVNGPSFWSNASASELCLVNWVSATPQAEIAILHSVGMDVFDSQGAALAQLVPDFGAGACMTSITEDDSGSQALVGIFDDGTNSWLQVFRAAGPEDSVPLGQNRPLAITSGDLNSDGNDDVSFSSRFSNHVFCAMHQGPGGPAFSNAVSAWVAIEYAPWGPSPVAMASQPCLVDVDADGDIDIYCGKGPLGGAFVQRSGVTPESDGMLPFTDLISTFQPGSMTMVCTLNLHAHAVPPSGQGWTHVEIDLWSLRVGQEQADPVGRLDVSAPAPGVPVGVTFEVDADGLADLILVARPVVRQGAATVDSGIDTIHKLIYDNGDVGLPSGTPIPVTPPNVGNVPVPAPPVGGPFN